MRPRVGIALMPEADFIRAALPLFEKHEIELIEWSFDVIPPGLKEPWWMTLLLTEFSDQNRLTGHGVRYSLLSGAWKRKQSIWLKQLAIEVKKYNYRCITEHFGFMTSDNFHKGAPLPVPLNKVTLAIGHDRLKRLQVTAQLPVGIENLAFAFNVEQVKEQGEFLEKLIAPINGFLVLDLHNTWCQSVNFDIDPLVILKSYPLDKVKEIHISGGSWSGSIYSQRKTKIRRDTHDEAVPKEVFALLKQVLPLCLHTESVIFERLGNTILSQKEQQQFIKDFKKIKKIVVSGKEFNGPQKEDFKKTGLTSVLKSKPLQDKSLKAQQDLVLKILSTYTDPHNAIKFLKNNVSLNKNNWNPGLWEDYMVETAMELIKKWN